MLVAERGRLMQALPAGGGMLAVQATEADAADSGLDIAAVNGPTSVVLSGSIDAIERYAAHCAEQGLRHNSLSVSHAFHSALMEPMLDAFAQVLDGLTFHPARIPIVSNLTGAVAEPGAMQRPEYWLEQVRRTVRFADGVATLQTMGVTRCLELGPDGVLSGMAQHTTTDAVFATVLRKDRDETDTALTALSRLWTSGATVDWTTLHTGWGGRVITLPTYPFQHKRYWPEPAPDTLTTPTTETGFWDAVEREDLQQLATELDLPETPAALGDVLPVLSAWRRRRRERSRTDSWRYRITWTPLDTHQPTPLTGTWALIGPEDTDITTALTTAGATVIGVPFGDVATGREESARALARLAEDFDDLSGIVVRADAVDTLPAQQGVPAPVAVVLSLVQALTDAGLAVPLWTATRGAVSIERSDPLRSPSQAAVWGLGRVAALEFPSTGAAWWTCPPSWTPARRAGWPPSWPTVARTRSPFARPASTVVACCAPPRRADERDVDSVGDGAGHRWHRSAGFLVARWLAGRGVPHLVLTSRSGVAPEGLIEELSESGTRVTVAACDVADRDALADVIAGVPAEWPLTGIVHAAGVGTPERLEQTGLDAVGKVLGSKVTGTVHLDELTRDLPIDLFLVFSSIAATWGSGGQGAYAAGNAFLDAWVQHRRDLGLPGTSIAWGPWAEVGLATLGETQDYLRRRGLRAMDPALAMQALADAVDGDRTP
ncbi:SDR family oxidoreductase [Streptomyces zhihengii]